MLQTASHKTEGGACTLLVLSLMPISGLHSLLKV